MQQRVILSGGKRYLVNVAANDDGVGPGFAVGQMVLKSYTDQRWYVVTASGSYTTATAYVSQSALGFVPTGSIYYQYDNTASVQVAPTFFEQNSPYQLLACNDRLAYRVYLTGTAPTATLTVSQSADGPAFITSSNGTRYDVAKPNLLLQSISDFNYYYGYLENSASVITLRFQSNMISQSWVKPVF
jgi:hypothetical protein